MTKRTSNIHRGRPVTRYFSKKNNRIIKVETNWELFVALELELDDNVKTYAAQPETFSQQVAGKNKQYTPDFLVEYFNETEHLEPNALAEYIEVHPAKFVDDGYRSKLKVFTEYTTKACGIKIRLIDDLEFNYINLTNLQLIADQRSLSLPQTVKDWFRTSPSIENFGQLINKLKSISQTPIGDAYQCLASKYVEAALSKKPLTSHTPLWVSRAC